MTHAASKDDLRVSTLFDFSSHVVLVTGGATGLGEMAAQAFVQNGAHVFIASRKESELRSTSTRLNELGPGKCDYIVADLKDKAGCLALCAELKKRTDRLTVLVNNSGASWGDDYYNYPEHAWDKLYALNVKSIFYMTVELEGLLAKGATAERPGRVINIASMAGITTVDVTTGEGGGLSKPGHGTFSYGPAKAACIHLTKMQASKLAPKNIMCNVICPGVFPSRMTNFGLEKYADSLNAGQPTGRVGKPSDFGGLVLFLSSSGSAHMTGNALEVDGGATLTGWRGKVGGGDSKL
ncbi:nad(P)-binding protein [Stemphylium lycopersici]|uniref:Nad(P)-binding protein n=1 Tax=Stemphylium lycopersici TaxID=183478 RepID=A0A364MTM1_STELY|nr:nad(P)-binding protein [Stemphylium lycopersici]RAQ99068.1 nad(P)-binding protein [Stemphylium lycopersici]RAR03101.1 nad(P)-binding protein [Stemphylium lycopersici]